MSTTSSKTQTPLTAESLRQNGYHEQIGFSKMLRGNKFEQGALCFEVAVNNSHSTTWYVYLREFNKGEADDLVTLRNDLQYVEQLEDLFKALSVV